MEMRVTGGDLNFASETAAQAAFAGGEKVGMTEELDEDTSAESWHNRGYRRWGYWNTPHYPGKWLGRGLWWGRNPYLYRSHLRYPHGRYVNYHYRARYYYPRYRYYTWCNNQRYNYGYHRY